jgi:hypothetical protein
MTQDITSKEAALSELARQLDATQAESVGGGADVCTILEATNQFQAAYENLVDTASHIIERVMNATRTF